MAVHLRGSSADLGRRSLCRRLALDAANLIRTSPLIETDVRLKSGNNDLVTRLDIEAEELVVRGIREHFPLDSIVREEGVDYMGTSGLTWLIDPIDGTSNFVAGSPDFAVSIAFEGGDGRSGATIVRPSDGGWVSLFETGVFGHARVGTRAGRDRPTVAVALPYGGIALEYARRSIDVLGLHFYIYRTGSAACDLMNVCTGLVDAHVSIGLAPWDTAAGHALIVGMGGLVDELPLEGELQALVAGVPDICEKIRTLLAAL